MVNLADCDGVMLDQRRKCWPNIILSLGCFVFAGWPPLHSFCPEIHLGKHTMYKMKSGYRDLYKVVHIYTDRCNRSQ